MLGSSTFRHGVHPPESKGLTEKVRVRRMPFPEEIVLPLRQHAGRPARLIVQVGDRVERGDKVGLLGISSGSRAYRPSLRRPSTQAVSCSALRQHGESFTRRVI